MKQKIKKIKQSSDFKNLKKTFAVVSINIIGSFFNYLFQLFCGRTLGPAEYGLLGVALSLFNILAIPSQTIQKIVSKFSSKLKSYMNEDKLFLFIKEFGKKIFPIQLLFFFIILFSSNIISNMLGLSITAVIIISLTFLLALVRPLIIGSLNGIQKFRTANFINLINFFLKFVITVILIMLGFKSNGALFAVFLSLTIATLLGLFFIYNYIHSKFQNYVHLKDFKGYRDFTLDFDEIFNYSIPVFITIMCLTLLTNADILLIKIFFNDSNVGYYLSAATIAKMITFFVGPFLSISFVKLCDLHEKGKNTMKYLYKSTFLVLILGFFATIFFSIFSKIIIKILYGADYLVASPLLKLITINVMLFLLINAIINYSLAIKNTNFLYILVPGTILELVLMYIYHHNLITIIWMTIISMSLILVGLIVELSIKEFRKINTPKHHQ